MAATAAPGSSRAPPWRASTAPARAAPCSGGTRRRPLRPGLAGAPGIRCCSRPPAGASAPWAATTVGAILTHDGEAWTHGGAARPRSPPGRTGASSPSASTPAQDSLYQWDAGAAPGTGGAGSAGAAPGGGGRRLAGVGARRRQRRAPAAGGGQGPTAVPAARHGRPPGGQRRRHGVALRREPGQRLPPHLRGHHRARRRSPAAGPCRRWPAPASARPTSWWARGTGPGSTATTPPTSSRPPRYYAVVSRATDRPGPGHVYFVLDVSSSPDATRRTSSPSTRTPARSSPARRARRPELYPAGVRSPPGGGVRRPRPDRPPPAAASQLLALDARDLTKVRWSSPARAPRSTAPGAAGHPALLPDDRATLSGFDTRTRRTATPAHRWTHAPPSRQREHRVPPPVLSGGKVYAAWWAAHEQPAAAARSRHPRRSHRRGRRPAGRLRDRRRDPDRAPPPGFESLGDFAPVLARPSDGSQAPVRPLRQRRHRRLGRRRERARPALRRPPRPLPNRPRPRSGFGYGGGVLWFGDNGGTLYGLDDTLKPLPHTPRAGGHRRQRSRSTPPPWSTERRRRRAEPRGVRRPLRSGPPTA